MKVLLVDDDHDYLVTLAQWFQGKGHEVTIARCGIEALEALRNHKFDAMVTDLVMPMSGAKLVEVAAKEGLSVPTIIVTGNDPWYAEVPGIAGSMSKPFSPEELERKLLEVVRL